MYVNFGKRIFDFTVAFLGLLFLVIPLFLIYALILVNSGFPVFFIQERIGKNGKIFKVVKFRTMTVNQSNDSTVTVARDKRITPIGESLRRWKLDELPQLWNVFVGEMSFVGPRPDVPGYADKLEGDDRSILSLKPGITGPATLAYRNEEEILAQVEDPIEYNNKVIFPDKVRINLDYLKNCSLSLDLYYIWKTIFH